MEGSMAPPFELPIKRANEEMGSEEERPSKKAQAEPGSQDAEYCGDDSDTCGPLFWYNYQQKMEDRYKARELRYYLTSKGQVDRAVRIQSEKDFWELNEEDWKGYRARNWDLETREGPYDDYQRLVVWDPCRDTEYRYSFCSSDSDTAYPKFFRELKEMLPLNSSFSDVSRSAQDLSKKYEMLNSNAVAYAIRESFHWLQLEVLKKDMIPILSKLCYEVLKQGRCIEQVVKETIGQVVGPVSRGESLILADIKYGLGDTRHVVNRLEKYITENNEESFFDTIHIERLLKRFFEEDPPSLLKWSTYADYVELKLQLAKQLCII